MSCSLLKASDRITIQVKAKAERKLDKVAWNSATPTDVEGLSRIALYRICGRPVSYCVVLYGILPHCTASYRIAPYRIASHCTVSYRIVSHCMVSYRIAPYRIVAKSKPRLRVRSASRRKILRRFFRAGDGYSLLLRSDGMIVQRPASVCESWSKNVLDKFHHEADRRIF